MKRRGTNAFRYTSLAISFLEKLISPKFSIEGIENVPQRPVLFVANHFTRAETFIIPYIIHKHTGRQVRCLGDSGLFKGGLGSFLTKVGAVSTKDKNRNKIIISDLMTGNYDWMIYPEGSMIKSKEIYFKGGFISHTPYGVSKAKTGATVLALKSELYRQDLIKAKKENNESVINHYKEKYGVHYSEEIKKIDTHIVPVNITYYPIRPGENFIKNVVQKLLKKFPKVIAEELEIEGNLILSANINISFGKSIGVADYSRRARSLVKKIPLIDEATKRNLVIQYLKYRLTSKFMSDIYFDTKVNLDHLFAAVIFEYKQDNININHLKNIIYNAAIDIAKSKRYRLSYSIEEKSLVKIFDDNSNIELDGVVELAKSLKIIKQSADGKFFAINQDKLRQKYNFHDIRTDNTLQVIYNEFSLLEFANLAVKKSMKIDEERLKKRVCDRIFNQDVKNFELDYDQYYEADLSKEKELGRPFFLDSKKDNRNVGIVVCHGYQSAPQEVRKMGVYLNELGFRVYGVRLKGHGTAPKNIQDVSHSDWSDSIERGYCAISRVCDKVIMVGFSTGGLLSWVKCAK
jgi:1-acyl-sn-glycerol-3-phosphate acyltransferase